MENILAPGGRRITPPRNYARQPRLVRLDRWTLCLGWIILVVGLLLQAQPASGVTFLWNRSTGSNIAGYRLFYGTASGSYSQIIDVGNATSFTVNGLLRGHTYYFVVTAYDTTGAESGPSNQVAFSPGSSIKDFDGDGQSDLVWENTSTGQRAIWFLKNGYLQRDIYLPTVSTQWHIAGVGDFLGNGQSDLVWQNTSTGQRAIWFMTNGYLQSTLNLPTVSTDWDIVEH